VQHTIDPLTQQVRERYQSYEQSLSDFSKQKNSYFGKISWLRIGNLNRNNNTDQLDQQFLSDVEALTQSAAQAVQSLPEGERDQALEELLAFLLSPKPPAQKRTHAEWTYCAAESCALPLLPLLSRQGRAALRGEYVRSHPKYSLTPNQQELLAAMDDET
jgi:hypothetical protein